MQLPTPDPTRLKRRGDLISLLREHLRADQIIHRREDVVAYECDGLSAYRQRPMLVALPDNTEQVAAVLRSCSQLRHSHRPLGRWHRAFRRCPAEGRWSRVEHGADASGPRHRLAKSRGDCAAGRDQPSCDRSGGAERLLLRTRSFESDRLLDWRQYRRKFRWGTLPQIRHDDQQLARLGGSVGRRRGRAGRRQGHGPSGLRLARAC